MNPKGPENLIVISDFAGPFEFDHLILDFSSPFEVKIYCYFFQAPRAANNGSGIGQLLRDPDHYEEINVIGNGESLKRTVMMMMVMMVTLFKHFMGKTL